MIRSAHVTRLWTSCSHRPWVRSGLCRRWYGIRNCKWNSDSSPRFFLGQGRWEGVQLREDKDRPDAWKRDDSNATQKDTLNVQVAPRGGFVGWFRRSE